MSYGEICKAECVIKASSQYPGDRSQLPSMKLKCGAYEGHDGPHLSGISFPDATPVGLRGQQYIRWTDSVEEV